MRISSESRGVLALGAAFISVVAIVLGVAGLNELLLVAWGHQGQMFVWPCAAVSLVLTVVFTRRVLRRRVALALRALLRGELTFSAARRKPAEHRVTEA